eukprot:COSAG01_NODE_17115_length_1177_cov_3.120594_1_plen_112_part_00
MPHRRDMVVGVIYPHGSNHRLRRMHVTQMSTLLRTRAPSNLPIYIGGDWNFVQNPEIDTMQMLKPGKAADHQGLIAEYIVLGHTVVSACLWLGVGVQLYERIDNRRAATIY